MPFVILGDGGSALGIDFQSLAIIALTIAIVLSRSVFSKSCPIRILEHLAALPLLVLLFVIHIQVVEHMS